MSWRWPWRRPTRVNRPTPAGSVTLRETEGIRLMDMIRLVPGEPTQIPGTRCEVRWDGEREITVYRRRDGLWDLSPLSRRGIVLAWQRLAERPHLGWWPIVPLTSRTTYRSTHSFVTRPEETSR